MINSYKAEINGIKIDIDTESSCFSPKGPDAGTLAMLSLAEIGPDDMVIDLGCGCGLVGIYAAKITLPEKVFMLDCDEISVKMAKLNAEKNGVPNVTILVSDAYDALDVTGFDIILSNPPYHTDFGVAKKFIEKGFNRLKIGGRMVMVTKRLDWYKNKLTSVFGGTKVVEKDGYFVFISEKRRAEYASARKKSR